MFDFVVMRQPTRKQRILHHVWGRAVFHFDLAENRGAAVMLEAQTIKPFAWTDSLGPDSRQELDRLRADGHDVRRVKRGFQVHPTGASLRNTMLYRTLLHEIGHHVDFRKCSVDEWASKLPREKEYFAHRYATELAASLRLRGVLPFDGLFDPASMLREGLQPQWFGES